MLHLRDVDVVVVAVHAVPIHMIPLSKLTATMSHGSTLKLRPLPVYGDIGGGHPHAD